MDIGGIAQNITDNLFDGLYLVDSDRKITYWNPAAEKITGFKSEEVLGKSCADGILVHVDEQGCCLCDRDCPLKDAAEKGTSCEGEVFFRHSMGYRVPVTVRTRPLTDDAGRARGAVSIFRESQSAGASDELLEELKKLALLDSLTGLPNRRYLERALDSHFDEMKRYDRPFGVLFIDIDNFKAINDEYGHETGDGVLRTVAGTLAHNTRPSDVAGRWGGEEFVAIIMNVSLPELRAIAEKFRALVEQSVFRSPSGAVGVTISIGATLARNGETPSELIGRADALMYRSKTGGKNMTTAAAAAEN